MHAHKYIFLHLKVLIYSKIVDLLRKMKRSIKRMSKGGSEFAVCHFKVTLLAEKKYFEKLNIKTQVKNLHISFVLVVNTCKEIKVCLF